MGCALWRLAEIIKHEGGWAPVMDFTFYAPTIVILACLEVDFACIAASMPVFWPMVESGFSAIFVTKEVHIVRHHRDDGREIELESRSGRSSQTSQVTLHPKQSATTWGNSKPTWENSKPTWENSKDPSTHSVREFDPIDTYHAPSMGHGAGVNGNRNWNNDREIF